MKVQLAAGRKVALWVWVCSSIYVSAGQAPATKPISGRPGIVVSRRVVNFSELAQREASLRARPAVPKVQPPEREAPRPKGLPAGAIVKLAPESSSAHPNASAAVITASPLSLLANNFPAEADNNTVIPPDTQGTVGPNHLMVALNSNIVVQDRAGNRLTTVSLDAFWAPTGNSRTTDPRVAYDPYNDRWIIATSGDFLLSTSGVLVGVSQNGDPTGNWNLYKVAVDSTNQHFCDFPVLGFNKSWVVVMCNVFANVSNSNFFSGNIYVFDKFDLYNHGAGTPTVLNTGGDSNVTPAITYDNNLATEYLVEEYNGNQSGMGMMRLWAINGPVGSPALSTVAFPATSVPWDESGTANFAPQLGTSTGIDVGDARIGNVVYRNGTLWTAHPVFYPCCAPTTPPNRSSIQWWQIDTSGNVLQRGVIDTPDHTYFRSYPSIAVNQYDDALIGYARFSATEHAGGFYSFRADSDPPGVLQGEATLRAGEASYVKTGSGGGTSNRWGDYSNTSVDPIDDTSFWTIQEYAAEPSSHWATWWGEAVLPPVAFQVSFTPPSSTLTAGVPLTDFAVTIADAQGHPVPAYTGTVHFTSSDPSFSMPDYTFSASDRGTHHFSGVTLFKAGAQSISLADLANSFQTQLDFTVVPGPPAILMVVGPATRTAGVPFSFTMTAKDTFQNTVMSYSRTVQFSSSDPLATLPGNYTFNPGVDNGSHSFNATLKRVGPQNILVFDGSLYGSLNVNVSPDIPHHLIVSAPANVTSGKPFTVSVTAQDQFNNVTPGYSGAVHFTSSDASHTLPPDYIFVGGDQGRHYFPNGVTLNTIGAQSVTATDTVTNTITGTASVNVAHLSGTARSLYVRLGKPFNGLIVATFSDDQNPAANMLAATIDWGDGGSSGGNIQLNSPGAYTVTGGHTYKTLPEHPATVTISDNPNGYSAIVTDTVRMWPKTESH